MPVTQNLRSGAWEWGKMLRSFVYLVSLRPAQAMGDPVPTLEEKEDIKRSKGGKLYNLPFFLVEREEVVVGAEGSRGEED